MYIAELHGKLSSRLERKEDILTSNIFSFLKYSNRKKYLKNLLIELGIKVSEKELFNAEFIFWPHYDDKTEPDVVIVVGQYYLLFEAKYFSDFSPGQIKREIEGGILESKNIGKKFYYIAITQDYYFKRKKFKIISSLMDSCYFKWMNWQKLSKIIEFNIENKDYDFHMAYDLYQLLLRKNLRQYQGFNNTNLIPKLKKADRIFFDAKSTKYRGNFIGFIKALQITKKMKSFKENIFFNRKYFQNFTISKFNMNPAIIFYEVKK